MRRDAATFCSALRPRGSYGTSRGGSGNVEWRRVRSLLDSVAAVTEEHDGKLRVTLGGETEVMAPPSGKDVHAQMLVDLRRMLTRAGITP